MQVGALDPVQLESLRREHDRVFLVGVSLGGLLSLRLAQTCEVDALVAFLTALEAESIPAHAFPPE